MSEPLEVKIRVTVTRDGQRVGSDGVAAFDVPNHVKADRLVEVAVDAVKLAGIVDPIVAFLEA